MTYMYTRAYSKTHYVIRVLNFKLEMARNPMKNYFLLQNPIGAPKVSLPLLSYISQDKIFSPFQETGYPIPETGYPIREIRERAYPFRETGDD